GQAGQRGGVALEQFEEEMTAQGLHAHRSHLSAASVTWRYAGPRGVERCPASAGWPRRVASLAALSIWTTLQMSGAATRGSLAARDGACARRVGLTAA